MSGVCMDCHYITTQTRAHNSITHTCGPFTEASASTSAFPLHPIPRPKGRLRAITSGLKPTFTWSATTNKLTGRTSCTLPSSHTTTTSTHHSVYANYGYHPVYTDCAT